MSKKSEKKSMNFNKKFLVFNSFFYIKLSLPAIKPPLRLYIYIHTLANIHIHISKLIKTLTFQYLFTPINKTFQRWPWIHCSPS